LRTTNDEPMPRRFFTATAPFSSNAKSAKNAKNTNGNWQAHVQKAVRDARKEGRNAAQRADEGTLR